MVSFGMMSGRLAFEFLGMVYTAIPMGGCLGIIQLIDRWIRSIRLDAIMHLEFATADVLIRSASNEYRNWDNCFLYIAICGRPDALRNAWMGSYVAPGNRASFC